MTRVILLELLFARSRSSLVSAWFIILGCLTFSVPASLAEFKVRDLVLITAG